MNNDFFYSDENKNTSTKMMKERLNFVSSHMSKQLKEYEDSTKNTNFIFGELIKATEEVVAFLKEDFEHRGISPNLVSFSTDADKSIAILGILWYSISFTMRENTKPQALYRQNHPPLFCGRILALNGDFQKASIDLTDIEYPDILACEIASLYIPADKQTPAIMKLARSKDTEYNINQQYCAKEFVLKIIEVVCGGGFYHEENYKE
ncbi:MAG: hypothetical protein MJ180_04620 [Candidatus Gastranaerophilales bacterium]|nr:hypothetical protein [Candidatus Gastranaerophilales bacterium]